MANYKIDTQLSSFYSRALRGFTVNKEYLPKALVDKLTKSKIEDQTRVSFFADILYPICPLNQENPSEKCLIKLRIGDLDEIIEIPLSSIELIWIAGWPRAGYMIERWIDFPWRLLKPFYKFIHHRISYESFIKQIQIKHYDDGLPITSMYFKLIPQLVSQKPNKCDHDITNSSWWIQMLQIYDDLIARNNLDIIEHFSISASAKPYTGLIINKKSLTDEKYDHLNNPFIKQVISCMETSQHYFIAPK